MTDLVYAFKPRTYDPPAFVAEDAEYLDSMIGGFIGGDQCDGCGNSVYRVEGAHGAFYAVCADDPADDREFAHPDPCGRRWPIRLYAADEVAF